MARFKAAGKKSKTAPASPGGGVPCLILLFVGMSLAILALVLIMKYAR
jgi:hypothetical protein